MVTLDSKLRERAHEKLNCEINKVICVYLPDPLANANYAATDMLTSNNKRTVHISVHQALTLVKKAIFDHLHEQWEEMEINEFIAKVDKRDMQ